MPVSSRQLSYRLERRLEREENEQRAKTIVNSLESFVRSIVKQEMGGNDDVLSDNVKSSKERLIKQIMNAM